jgi:aldose 1-epimerase
MTGVRSEPFGVTESGESVERYVLGNGHLEVSLLTWGATVQSLLVPDRNGDHADVVLGFDGLTGYLGEHPYFGAVIGRYANRIARGRFFLDGVAYQVPPNDRGNALHGGPEGFHRKVWSARPTGSDDAPAVELIHVSPYGDMGFPGTLESTVTYTLDGDQIRIDYRATTDRPTVVNLTQHSYFNLAGPNGGSIESHELEIRASHYLSVDAESIPTGQPAPVDGTPFDFRRSKLVGRDIGRADEQLAHGLGYDHSWVLDRSSGSLSLAARVIEPGSGRGLEVLTTEPAVQFYSGNQLDGTLRGKGNRPYQQREGMCLETQHLPDSPNRPDFPSVVLRPGETHESTTVWRFSTA